MTLIQADTSCQTVHGVRDAKFRDVMLVLEEASFVTELLPATHLCLAS